MKKNILIQVNNLLNNNDLTFSILEKAENLILDYLKEKENDTQMWYYLAILDLMPPLVDFDNSINYLKNVWNISKEIKAIIYIAVIQDIHCMISDEIFNIIKEYKTNDKKLLSMCHYCMGLYFKDKENFIEESIQSFMKTIELYPCFVHSYYELGKIYKKENSQKSKLFYENSYKNVKSIFNETTDYNWLSIDNFENEIIFGTHLTQEKYDYLKQLSL